jgi:hypothetical protein
VWAVAKTKGAFRLPDDDVFIGCGGWIWMGYESSSWRDFNELRGQGWALSDWKMVRRNVTAPSSHPEE